MQDPGVAKEFPGITLHLIREHFEELHAAALSIRCVQRNRAHVHTHTLTHLNLADTSVRI